MADMTGRRFTPRRQVSRTALEDDLGRFAFE
jgi:hypothetical protein